MGLVCRVYDIMKNIYETLVVNARRNIQLGISLVNGG
jgi:hypothetical protein